MLLFAQMLFALLVILIAAEIFTNALEHLGERLRISEGVTGSLFAAVGTAMPESIIPLLALLAGTKNSDLNHEIGVGAILGAPLMLSTLTLCLMASFVLRQRKFSGRLYPEPIGLKRDLHGFLIAFGIAAAALFLPPDWTGMRYLVAGLLVVIYFVYVFLTVRASSGLVANGHGTETEKDLYFTRFKLRNTYPSIVAQMIFGLALLIAGAKGFIHSVEAVTELIGISALILSMLIVPVATELPEKVNSVLWIRRKKDTLAFGNITGAMMFQGSLLPAIGLLLTPWTPRFEVVAGVTITYLAAIWLRMFAHNVQVWHLFVNGFLYIAYITLLFI